MPITVPMNMHAIGNVAIHGAGAGDEPVSEVIVRSTLMPDRHNPSAISNMGKILLADVP